MKNKQYQSGTLLSLLLCFSFNACVAASAKTSNNNSSESDFDQAMSQERSRQLVLVNSTSMAEKALAKLQNVKPDHAISKQQIDKLSRSIKQRHQQIVQLCLKSEEYDVIRRTVDTPAMRNFIASLGNIEESSIETFIEQKTLARIKQLMVGNQMSLLEQKFREEGKQLTENERTRFINELAEHFEPLALQYRPTVVQTTIAHAGNQLQAYNELVTQSMLQQQKTIDLPAAVIESNATNPWFTLALLSLLGLFFGDVMWEKAKDKITLATIFLKNKIDNNKRPIKKKIK